MRFLIDTHVFAWWLYGNARLSPFASAAISDQNNQILVSTVSAYEMALKYQLGKWDEVKPLVSDFSAAVQECGFVELPLNTEHAITAGLLISEHRDPFDRMLAAQSTVEGAALITIDQKFNSFDITTIW